MKKSVKEEVKKVSDKKCYWCASMCDIASTKWAVFFFTLFLVTLFPRIASQDWKWAFLVMAILISIKPLISFFKK